MNAPARKPVGTAPADVLPFRKVPHNIEAEQALLGAILVHNEAYARVSGLLEPHHFYDPLHQQIYAHAGTLITSGERATAITLRTFFEYADPVEPGVPVPLYLARLAANASTTEASPSNYAKLILEFYKQRQLITAFGEIQDAAYDPAPDFTAADQFDNALATIEELRDTIGVTYSISARPYVYVPAHDIPPRPVLYGPHIRGLVSMTAGRPGAGKTKLAIAEALAKTTGRRLLHDTPTDRFRVWCWFGEEAQEDLDRLLTAAMNYYGITQADIAGRLFIHSRDQRMVVAKHGRDGLSVAWPVVREVKHFIKDNGIDSATVDPFVKSHGAPENDNGAIDQVTGIWSEIAHETRCHIDLNHHTRKNGGGQITVDDVRGGSAIIGAVRSARILNAMSGDEAAAAGVEPAWAHVRIDDGKTNNLPPAKARWLKLATVDLAHGDASGVATPWEWPDPFEGVNVANLLEVQKLVDAGRFRANVQAKDWVGLPVAKALGLDATQKADRKRIGELLKTWIANGALVTVPGEDKKRRPRTFIEVSEWAAD